MNCYERGIFRRMKASAREEGYFVDSHELRETARTMYQNRRGGELYD